MEVAQALIGKGMYATGIAVLDREVPTIARWAIQTGSRAPLDEIGAHGAAIMERFGDARVRSTRGRTSLPASLQLSDAWLRLLGLFIAEGHVADEYATITPGPGSTNFARDLLSDVGITFFERGRDELGIGSRVVTEFLCQSCGSRAGEKHLPDFWPDLSQRALGLLLGAYFEGDGWVEGRGAAVCATTKSTRLANELAYALLRFGIVARLHRGMKRAVGTSHAGDRVLAGLDPGSRRSRVLRQADRIRGGSEAPTPPGCAAQGRRWQQRLPPGPGGAAYPERTACS